MHIAAVCGLQPPLKFITRTYHLAVEPLVKLSAKGTILLQSLACISLVLTDRSVPSQMLVAAVTQSGTTHKSLTEHPPLKSNQTTTNRSSNTTHV
mmetsp:Transcript_10529/g.18397  ORF Transcript_10529/g.18397 Transcript_10529/m.18397 type:complete len:95 (-) Transcript_10529:798-1082(-)